MLENFEYMLAYHCAPTLTGMKSGNIFSLRHHHGQEIEDLIHTYNQKLNIYGIFLEILCFCESRTLLYVYRKSALMAELTSKEMEDFLKGMGYENPKDLCRVMQRLKERLNTGEEFPHEIGAFLSYPIEDIKGFIRFKGKQYKLNGYWKVYTNVHEARKIFEDFSKCRHVFCEQLSEGKNLGELVYAA